MTKDSFENVFVEYTTILGFQHYYKDDNTREKMFVEYFIIEMPNNMDSISTDDMIKMKTLLELVILKSSIPLAQPYMTLEGVLCYHDSVVFKSSDPTYLNLIESLLTSGLIKRMVKGSAPITKIKEPRETLFPDDFNELNLN
jgi:hypothetical protein